MQSSTNSSTIVLTEKEITALVHVGVLCPHSSPSLSFHNISSFQHVVKKALERFEESTIDNNEDANASSSLDSVITTHAPVDSVNFKVQLLDLSGEAIHEIVLGEQNRFEPIGQQGKTLADARKLLSKQLSSCEASWREKVSKMVHERRTLMDRHYDGPNNEEVVCFEALDFGSDADAVRHCWSTEMIDFDATDAVAKFVEEQEFFSTNSGLESNSGLEFSVAQDFHLRMSISDTFEGPISLEFPLENGRHQIASDRDAKLVAYNYHPQETYHYLLFSQVQHFDAFLLSIDLVKFMNVEKVYIETEYAGGGRIAILRRIIEFVFRILHRDAIRAKIDNPSVLADFEKFEKLYVGKNQIQFVNLSDFKDDNGGTIIQEDQQLKDLIVQDHESGESVVELYLTIPQGV